MIGRFIVAATVVFLPAQAHGQEGDPVHAVDIEHIFGFTEGSDVGKQGERELESQATDGFGRPAHFVAFTDETSFRYGVTDNFRASIGALVDEYRRCSRYSRPQRVFVQPKAA
jgi:hypothetical protein